MIDHKEIMEIREESRNADYSNREDAINDLRFISGDQWEEEDRQARESTGRPVITINRMPQFIQQITGDMRQNDVGIRAIGVDDDDEEKADVYNGLIRDIEYQSQAKAAYAHAFWCSVACGIGHFKVDTRYVEDHVSDQEIVIKRITDPLSVLWDGAARNLDRSDAKHCFVDTLVTERDYEKKYKGASQAGLSEEGGQYTTHYWRQASDIRLSEFWYKESYKKKLVQIDDGSIYDVTGIKAGDMQFMGEVVREREADAFKIKRAIIGNDEVLEDFEDWAGSHIPIIPVIGSEVFHGDVYVRSGLIRWAKDAQRLYNYWRSTVAEYMGSQVKSQYLVTPAMIEGFEKQWNAATRSPRPFLPYNPDPNAPGASPKREAPPTPPNAMWQESQFLSEEMKAVTGIYDASLGAKSNETSGKAILARQQKGDVANFHFHDNFHLAMKREGEILVDLIPKIYDGERVVRMLNEDGKEAYQEINKLSDDGKSYKSDMSVGRFDVRINVGPASTTQRMKNVELMMEILRGQPQLIGVIGDLLFDSMDDFKDSDKIAERLRKMNPQLNDADEDDPEAQAAQQQQQQAEAAMAQMQQELQQRGVEAEIGKAEAEAQKAAVDAQTAQVETEVNAEKTLADIGLVEAQTVKTIREAEYVGIGKGQG